MPFETVHKKIILTNAANYFKTYYDVSFCKPILSVVPVSQIYVSAILLLIFGNQNIQGWNSLQKPNIHTKFHEH
jgi:hypothetical protein